MRDGRQREGRVLEEQEEQEEQEEEKSRSFYILQDVYLYR